MKRAISMVLSMALLALLVPTGVFSVSAAADFRFSKAFGNDMVLQANKPISLFGFGAAGDQLTVSVVRDKDATTVKSTTATVAANGKWSVVFDEGIVGSYDTYTLTVSRGTDAVSLTGVVFGELWIASGQSNMAWKLAQDYDLDTIKAKQRNENIRVFYTSNWSPNTPAVEPAGSWKKADTWENIATVSAVGYYFAEQLQETLDVPVGLISAAAGGTNLAAWLTPEILEKYPQYEELLTKKGYVADGAGHGRYVQYNGLIAPFTGLQMAGMIWYQGCNESSQKDYDVLEQGLPVLYEAWNGLFNHSDEPMGFYCVQLTPYMRDDLLRSEANIALENGVQAINAKTGVAMSVPTYDIGMEWEANGDAGEGWHEIHPRRKLEVGQRLGAAALGQYYQKSTIYSGPVPSEVVYNADGTITIDFVNVGDGLETTDGEVLSGFLTVRWDGKMTEATAEIVDEDTVKVTPTVTGVVGKVAYAYGKTMRDGNLSNSEGFLPLTFIHTRPLDSGDVNGDGKVSTVDARTALRAAIGKVTLTVEQAAAADVNGDTVITAADARKILQYTAEKIDSLD